MHELSSHYPTGLIEILKVTMATKQEEVVSGRQKIEAWNDLERILQSVSVLLFVRTKDTQ